MNQLIAILNSRQLHSTLGNKYDKMINLIDTNLNLHACQVASESDDMRVFRKDHFSYVDSGLSCDTFNILHIFDGANLRSEELSNAIEYFQKRDLEYCIWVHKENLTVRIQHLLSSLSLSRQNEEIGMVLDLEEYKPIAKEQHENIREVDSESLLSNYAEVIAQNWNPPDENVMRCYQATSGIYLDNRNQIKLLLYFHNGLPVSTVEMFPTDDKTIGLYGLSTLSEFRGKGIGSAVMTFALNHAKVLGYKKVILQASEDGIGIYKKLGFKAYTTYFEYA